MGESSTGGDGWVKNIWELGVPNKIKRRVWTNSLPTQINMVKRKVFSSPLCNGDCETTIHALRDCSMVKQIWKASGLLLGARVWAVKEGWEWLKAVWDVHGILKNLSS